MPRPPPGLWGALRLAYREGVSRLSNGAQAPPRNLKDLNYRQALSSTIRHVVTGVAKPLRPSATTTTAPQSAASVLRVHAAPATIRNFSSTVAAGPLYRAPAPLRRGAHLGGTAAPPFRSSVPKSSQVGLQLHYGAARGFHAGAARQVLQNVVENAPLGVRVTWELEWRKTKRPSPRARLCSDKQKENAAGAPLKVELFKKAVLPTTASPAQADIASSEVASFGRFFPAVDVPFPTSLLFIPLANFTAVAPSDWTDILSPPQPPLVAHPLLPRPVARALKEHSDASTTHSLRLRSLFAALAKVPDRKIKDAWVADDGRLVVRLERTLAWSLVEGRENWLDVQDELGSSPTGDGDDEDDARILLWREQVVDASPPSTFIATSSAASSASSTSEDDEWLALDQTWSDLATHDRVASRFVIPPGGPSQ